MSWTDERVETLKKMWADGQSASQIAKELGGVTRNAVIAAPDPAQPAQLRKVSLRDARMLPRLAIVDPALTDHCPRAITLGVKIVAISDMHGGLHNPFLTEIAWTTVPHPAHCAQWRGQGR